MKINNATEFSEMIKAGPYAWPGCYPIYFVTSDCEVMSFEAAKKNEHLICEAIKDEDNSGWRVVGAEINYEESLFCAHTGKPIEAAYA